MLASRGHSCSGSGADVREITGDYRKFSTRRPGVMQKASEVLLSAVHVGQQPVRPGQLVLQLRTTIPAAGSSHAH